VSSRLDEKQHRRAARETHERELAPHERRRRRLRLTGRVALSGVVLAGLAALTTVGNGSRTRGLPAGMSGPFGQHYEGLEQRRVAAGVSTMALPSADVHAHPQLAAWAKGRRLPVPADIGIDPHEDPGQMAGLHTHDDDGTIHNEGQADATLGQFFRLARAVLQGATRPIPQRQGRRRADVGRWQAVASLGIAQARRRPGHPRGVRSQTHHTPGRVNVYYPH
jgi:hypothetical protein